MRLRALCMLFVLVAFISGCSTTTTKATHPLQPNILRVVRKAPLFTRVRILDITIKDAKKVQAVYLALQAQPPALSRGIMHCPLDQDVDYHLSFFHDDIQMEQVVYHPQGCGWIKLEDGTMKSPSASFLTLLAATLGVTPEELHGPFPSWF